MNPDPHRQDSARNTVVITQAEEINYLRDFVALPGEYGTLRYEQREDVKAIRKAVNINLNELDGKVHFSEKIKGRKVIIKPNLVTVFHNLGMRKSDYPESTDPRVLDAVVLFLQQFTRSIVIAESSGRGMPTWASFKIAGLDRLARHRQVQLIALEEQPVERYLLPKARVMREIVIPRIFSEIVSGEAFYISVPKMKTNLYTGVTLGFKNAMGTIPYNLRQRNHTYDIDQKLVDMLHLFKPDLVIIDGIVGGEGNCPAPVDPVVGRVIISGNHAVETDRVATRMMGFDPASIRLMQLADDNGFGEPHVEVLGEEPLIPFKPADPSLFNSWMEENFPNVRVLMGQVQKNEDERRPGKRIGKEQPAGAELDCRGGCLATTRFGFDMLYHEGVHCDFPLTVLLGRGISSNGEFQYFDSHGNVYTLTDIEKLKGKKLAIGSCTQDISKVVDKYLEGCMPFPNAPHMLLHRMSGTACRVMSLRNRNLLPALIATLRTCEQRKKILRSGERLDVPLRHENMTFPIRALSMVEQGMDFVREPFNALAEPEIKKLCKEENRNVWATFMP